MSSVTTLPRLFLHVCQAYPKPDLLRAKSEGRWQSLSTSDFESRVRRLSLGLRELGLRPGNKAAIISDSRPEWVMADLAILAAGGVTVPVFPTLPQEQVRYILEDSDAVIVFGAGAAQWEKIAALRPKLARLRHAIRIEGEGAPDELPLETVLAMGAKAEASDPGAFEAAALAVAPDDLASIIYTSGTTGRPKGVMLTHDNFVSNIHQLDQVVPYGVEDVNLSFLPLSHVLERTGVYLYLFKGCSIAFAENALAVGDNMIEIRPTKMIGVPRLFEKIYARVIDTVGAGSPLKKKIFFWALRTGKRHAALTLARRRVPKSLAFRRGLAHKLVFSKILAKTGGRVKFMVCGGAALATDITEFFYAMGLTILPGYGLTETSPVVSGNVPDIYKFGTVGKPVPGVEVRIAGDGEILVKGPNVMRGYYKDEAATREALVDGWLHTGDIGRLDEDGFLIITDRKKDLIVTSGGKNVAPQPIESLVLTSPFIQNIVVVGADRKFVAALVVPYFEKIEAIARTRGIAFGSRSELCRRPEIVAFLQAEIDKATPDLAAYERIKKIAVLDHDLEIEAGEITPTLKVKRDIIEQKFKAVLDDLYAD
jgi:long-chain acyl-CoA synthetase